MVKDKVVLAYSGGLDTSITIPWLKENYDMDVIACCVNVGQDDDMEEVKKKAIASGAQKIYVENVGEEFLTDYAYKCLKAGAVYENTYLLGTSHARPLIAKKLVEVAQKEGAKYICHGCTGKGNDQVRFETGIAAMDPTIKIIAPWRIWDIKSREDAIDYANEHGIELTVTKEKIYSRDQNLWHISHEGGDIEFLENEHKDEIYMMVKSLEDAIDTPEYIEIGFEQAKPVSLNGEKMTASELVGKLNKIAGEHGIGVIDIVENRVVGMKSRGIYETPAGTVLYKALQELESVCLDKESMAFKKTISQKYGDLVYSGLWFTPLRESFDAFLNEMQKDTTGSIKLKLYKGNMKVAGRFAEKPLYDEGVASFGASDMYDHKDAEGFIKLFSLSTKIQNLKNKK